MKPKPVLRTIVPNTTNALLLRVYPDFEERVPIIAWEVELEQLRRNDGSVADVQRTFPISFEEQASNCIEFVVFGGTLRVLDECQFNSDSEAIDYAREELKKREPKARS